MGISKEDIVTIIINKNGDGKVFVDTQGTAHCLNITDCATWCIHHGSLGSRDSHCNIAQKDGSVATHETASRYADCGGPIDYDPTL